MTGITDRVTTVTLRAAVLRLGDGYIASGELAGVKFRGNRKRTGGDALKDLFMQLTQGVNMDAELAVDLAAAGEDYAAIALEAAALTDLAAGGAITAPPKDRCIRAESDYPGFGCRLDPGHVGPCVNARGEAR